MALARYGGSLTQHPGNEVGYFLPFPKDLFPNVQDQEAVLSHSACRKVIADMEILIKDLLKGESRILYVRQQIKVGKSMSYRAEGTRQRTK